MPQRTTSLRLLHTSDIHIGEDLAPDTRLDSLGAVIDVALEHQVDAVIIAGDLFDSSRVKPHVVEATLEQLRRLKQPTVIIPGNHDCVDETSIYHRVDLREAGDHVHFAGDPEGGHIVFDNLNLHIWARGIEDHNPGHKPLQGYKPHDDESYWRVVVTHGHFVPDNEDTFRSSIIRDSEIGGLKADYVALGHWHRFVDVSADGVAAFYSGSPGEPYGDFSSVNLVSLDPAQGVVVERVRLER